MAERGVPRLLVSVRDAEEARLALSAGVDLLDVKEPRLGSLGRADAAVVAEVLAAVRQSHAAVPVSAACGELAQWAGPDRPERFLQIAQGLSFLKLGLSHMRGCSDWPDRWRRVREDVAAAGDRSPRWVATVYVDADARAPRAQEVIAAAAEAGCAGVLFDTWAKRSAGLLGHCSIEQLRSAAADVRQAGMFCAVAGRLQAGDIEQLAGLPIDVVAVRSAACVGGDRGARLERGRIVHLRERLAAAGDHAASRMG